MLIYFGKGDYSVMDFDGQIDEVRMVDYQKMAFRRWINDNKS